MARFKTQHFVDNRKAEPFEVDVSTVEGEEQWVTFKDPNRLTLEVLSDLDGNTDPVEYLKALLGDDWDAFWAVWKDQDGDAVSNLVKEITKHFRRD